VGAWSFDETSGTTVVDASGKGNHGTLSGATRATGRSGRALTFDGINDLVTVADSSSLDLTTGSTVEAWVKPSALGSMWRTVLIKEQPAQLSYALYAGNGNGRPSGHVFNGRDSDAVGSSGLPLNAWTHLATTWDGQTVRLYVNGAQVAQRAVSGRITTSGSPLRIGGNKVWDEWFKGQIDDVRVYNRALTAAQIGADRATPVAAATTASVQAAKRTTAARAKKAGKRHKKAGKRHKKAAKHRKARKRHKKSRRAGARRHHRPHR
jgi:hypothetical protein